MNDSRPFFRTKETLKLNIYRLIRFIPLLILVGLLFVACNDDTSGGGTSSKPGTSSTQRESLELEAARRALVVMVESFHDAALKGRLADLAEKSEKGPAMPDDPENYSFRFGPHCNISLRDRSWNVQVFPDNDMPWFYYGTFRRNQRGEWEAVETSRRGQGTRSGR